MGIAFRLTKVSALPRPCFRRHQIHPNLLSTYPSSAAINSLVTFSPFSAAKWRGVNFFLAIDILAAFNVDVVLACSSSALRSAPVQTNAYGAEVSFGDAPL